jgi:hypothetical protein
MTASKTLVFVLAAALTGEGAADFLASDPIRILCILAVIGFWRYVLVKGGKAKKPSKD